MSDGSPAGKGALHHANRSRHQAAFASKRLRRLLASSTLADPAPQGSAPDATLHSAANTPYQGQWFPGVNVVPLPLAFLQWLCAAAATSSLRTDVPLQADGEGQRRTHFGTWVCLSGTQ